MTKKLPSEPDLCEKILGLDEGPTGTWHMHRFIKSIDTGLDAPETTQFFYNAFKSILKELQESKGTGIKDRDRILSKNIPITASSLRKECVTDGMTAEEIDNSPGNRQTYQVIKLMAKGIIKSKAVSTVAEEFDVDSRTVERNFKRWEKWAKEDHRLITRIMSRKQ